MFSRTLPPAVVPFQSGRQLMATLRISSGLRLKPVPLKTLSEGASTTISFVRALVGEDGLVGTVEWGQDVADTYDATSVAMYDPAVLDPAVDFLADLAGGGPALEFAVGTGRVALPLSDRGVEVHGIELSAPMVDQLQRKPGADAIPVTIGDMTSARAPGEFALVYLVWNTIMNVTTQAEQVAVFRNAAAHLKPGGCFVVEVIVPQLRSVPRGEVGRVFVSEPNHVGIETFDDLVGQVASSHHWMSVNGSLVHHSAPYRYVWPSELDLMAQLAGLSLEARWADWQRTRFTSDSASQIAIFRAEV